jgi:hypothetical protein
LEEDDIVVGDGRRFEADVLVLCTGYTFGFPFLEPQGLVPVTVGKSNLSFPDIILK